MTYNEPATPLYSQVKESLAQKIGSGEIRTNEKLPSERELCDIYNVSRLTIRQAMSELRNEGLVYSVQGKGTYAGKPRIKHGLSTVVGFCQSLKSRGLTPRTQLLFQQMKAHSQAAAFFGIGADEPLFNTGILGFGNDEPLVFYDNYTARDVGERLGAALAKTKPEEMVNTTREYYEALGLRLDKSVQTLNAVNADAWLSKLLAVPAGTALLKITSEVYRQGGMPIEYKQAYYNANQYSFHIVRDYM